MVFPFPFCCSFPFPFSCCLASFRWVAASCFRLAWAVCPRLAAWAVLFPSLACLWSWGSVRLGRCRLSGTCLRWLPQSLVALAACSVLPEKRTFPLGVCCERFACFFLWSRCVAPGSVGCRLACRFRRAARVACVSRFPFSSGCVASSRACSRSPFSVWCGCGVGVGFPVGSVASGCSGFWRAARVGLCFSGSRSRRGALRRPAAGARSPLNRLVPSSRCGRPVVLWALCCVWLTVSIRRSP